MILYLFVYLYFFASFIVLKRRLFIFIFCDAVHKIFIATLQKIQLDLHEFVLLVLFLHNLKYLKCRIWLQ